MLTLSAVAPAMERAELVHEPVAESEHYPAQCPPTHDHTVCTQVGANLPVVTTGRTTVPAPPVVAWTGGVQLIRTITTTFAEGHPSRAPPLA